jgi:hypothetical protein
LAADLLRLSAAAEKFMIYTVVLRGGNTDKADLSDLRGFKQWQP